MKQSGLHTNTALSWLLCPHWPGLFISWKYKVKTELRSSVFSISSYEMATAKCVEWHVPACSVDYIAEPWAGWTKHSSSALNRCVWPKGVVSFYSCVSIIASQHTHTEGSSTFLAGLKAAVIPLSGHVTCRCHLKPTSNARHVPKRNSVPFLVCLCAI